MNYYNEWDHKTACWLRELIKSGLIPNGFVDERSITEIKASDLTGYRQCHFFAGIGGWAYALSLAGWPEDRPVWTGSCPCQPWSIGNVWQGGGKGPQDPRDLWPSWFWLIGECKPTIVFGEQVANAIYRGWLDRALCDLEGIHYACGSSIIPALLVGARHERKRLWFVADSRRARWERYQQIARIPEPATKTQPVYGDTLTRAWRALDGDCSDLLHCNGLSVSMERDALKGYGNAIVPQVAAEFIKAYLEAEAEISNPATKEEP